MTREDFPVFSAKLVELAELFDSTLSESKQVLYFEALSDADLDYVLGAIHHATKACKFFPKPAELLTFINGDEEDNAEAAWMEFKALARSAGGYSSPTFSDPALAQTIVTVFGSWQGACWTDFSPEMWAAKRKEFGRVHSVVTSRGIQGQTRLIGFFEQQNALNGYQTRGDENLLPAADKPSPMTKLGQ